VLVTNKITNESKHPKQQVITMSMATTHENPMGSHGKPPKSGSTRRKISLPWFRQASIGEKLTRLRLPRQNTVDCPSSRPSSSAERLNNIRRKVMSSSSSVEALCGEVTWVVSDYNGGPGELSVRAGQQVEVLDQNNADQLLVRLCPNTLSEVTRPDLQEGYVPLSCLKAPPSKTFQLSKSSGDADQDGNCDVGPVSPVNKRRVFSGKWLPSIRKLSQGKLEKSQSIGGHDARQLRKEISKTKFKFGQTASVDVGMGNKASHSQSESEDSDTSRLPPSGRGRGRSEGVPSESIEEGEDPEVELPPPMRPISSIPAAEEGSSNKRDAHGDWNGISDGSKSTQANSETNSLLATDSPKPPRIVAEQKSCDQKDNSVPAVESGDPVTKAVEQRAYRLQELLESERMYVTDLEQAHKYITYMRESKELEEADIRMPDDLRLGKDRMIFGNLESIYEWHRDYFSKNLEKCSENPVELGNLFKKSERKFQMYVVYCQNKPKSEYIVSEHIDTYFEEIRLKHGFKLRLTDLLIKPIQRLTKYHMLLEAILKHSQRAGLVEEAVAIEQAFHVMTVVPNQANDMMDIGRLQGFEGKIVSQGKLLLRGPLLCTDDPSSGPNYKMKEMTVFLFEQIMIFAETVGKKTQFTSPVYTYKAHIQVNKMQFEERVDGDSDNKMFKVRSTDPRGPPLTYMCQAEDQVTRNRWTGTMSKQLQTQKEFLQALQAPIAYHNKLLKEL